MKPSIFASAALLIICTGSVSAADPVLLTDSAAKDRNPTWAADGSFLVFQSNRTGGWHLFRVSAAGGEAEQVTFSSTDEMYPEISPDGTRIVFAQGDADPSTGGVGSTAIRIMPVSGGAATTLVPDDGFTARVHPTWSPDGSTIFYTREVIGNGNWDIYKVSAAGGAESFVLDRGDDYSQSISPDGTRIAFASHPPASPYNLIEAPLDAPIEYTQLTSEAMNTSQPDYSPDGTRIAFCSRKFLGRLDLFELDLSSREWTRLTFDAETSAFDPVSQFPEYSPDGGRIAFSSARVLGNENIWVLNLSGTPPFPNVIEVGNGRGLPGSGTVMVPVLLQSTENSLALEFRLADLPDWLEVSEIHPVGRARELTASFADDGEAHVLLYSPNRSAIPAGAGQILEVHVRVRPEATEGDSVSLSFTDVILSDTDGAPLSIETEGGMFLIRRLDGDVNGDNLVDVGDLVRLVEIILGTGDPASPEESAAADCNQDAAHNVLDIPCLVDLILDDGLAPSSPAAGQYPAGSEPLVLSVEEEVRGIQFRVSAADPLPIPTPELAPFDLRTRSSDAGHTAIAFDPQGRGWMEGKRVPLRVGSNPANLRAYGAGGRPLPVTVTSEGLRIGQPIPSGIVVGAPGKNPFRASTEIRFSIDHSARIEVTILDIRGTRVATLPARNVSPGYHAWVWDARDDQGRLLPTGVYIALVESEGQRGAVRLTYLGR